MQLRIKFSIGDRVEIIDTNLFTIVAWERKYNRKSSRVREDGLGIEDIAYMCHESAKQAKIDVPIKLDEFIQSLTDLEVVEVAQNPKADADLTATL